MGTTKEYYDLFWKILSATPQKTTTVRPSTPNLTTFEFNKQYMLVSDREIRTKSLGTFSYRLLHIGMILLSDKQILLYISSEQILDAVKRTWCPVGSDGLQWRMKRERERESKKFVQSSWFDYIYIYRTVVTVKTVYLSKTELL